jgi:hypothetical protein
MQYARKPCSRARKHRAGMVLVEVLVRVVAMLHQTGMVLLGGGNGAAPPPPIFNLGLQKSGTSSFADFVWRQLKLTTFHAHVHLLQSLGGVHESGCVSSGAQDKQYPDSSGWLSILNHTERLATVLRSRAIGAWGDTPVAFMLPLIEKVVPDAKYVLWPRASDSWAA